MELKQYEFDMIRDLAMRAFGLDLREGKERLVATRLGRHVRAGGYRSFRHYCDEVRSDQSGELLVSLIDALTTNHTAFLREPAHFDFVQDLLQGELRDRRNVDIWTAASATGEEPYTLLFSAMSASDRAVLPEVRILASDISTQALSTARRGLYSRERLAGLPPEWIRRFFETAEAASPGCVQVRPQLRSRIQFQRINLIEPLPPGGVYPIIFCRNVMIYFNRATRANVVNRLAANLEPGGYLFVGHSESLSGIDHPLQYVRPAVYRRTR